MMEVPIQVAVRIKPITNVNDIVCIQSIPYNNTIQVGNQQSFPVSYALPQDCSQSYIFLTTVSPLINCLVEGCDVSVVSLGQTESGKTYTLLGPGLHCAYSESEHGIIPRFIREIFSRLSTHHDRNITISITWTQICGENIQDLLGNGSVQVNNVSDAFHWLQLGISNIAPSNAHTLFTLTVEQQYVVDSIIEHKISTVSFTDLCSCEKVMIVDNYGEPRSIPLDNGLLSLHNVISTLTETVNQYIPYNQSTLTTLLKDSFGGRAKTLIICCLSPLLRDFSETIYSLQLSVKIQYIRNYVTTNSYTNNTTTTTTRLDEHFVESKFIDQNSDQIQNELINQRNNYQDMFGLHFAITQWTKLVSNAENLFNKLITTKELSDREIEQITEWLLLKAECEECLSSEETISIDNLEPQRSLGRIEEENEIDNDTNITETDGDSNSLLNESESNEISESEEFESEECSDLDQQKPDFLDKLDSFMQTFRLDTDHLLSEIYYKETNESISVELSKSTSSNEQLKLKGARGRRVSIHPPGNGLIPEIISGNVQMPEIFSDIDIDKINLREFLPVSVSQQKDCKEITKYSSDPTKQLKTLTISIEIKQKKIRQIITDLESGQKQIDELEYTIQIKESLIASMIKNGDIRNYAKQKFHKKRSKLQQEYYKARTQLAQTENNLLHCHTISKLELKDEIERYRNVAQFYEKRLKDLESIRIITEDSARKVLELQNSLHTSKKQLDRLRKTLRKEDKQKQSLEQELIEDRIKIAELESQKTNKSEDTSNSNKKEYSETNKSESEELFHKFRRNQSKINKTNDEFKEEHITHDDKDSLRHEIRNLRRTRDCLLEQRCLIDMKYKKEKMLSENEERKLLEFEEAISAIDCAIEYKNELICGRKLQITNDELNQRSDREKGEELLMQRLLKLSQDEMRTLLYKYFNRVIDLRESSKKLELQNMQLERERDSNIWRIQTLSHLLQQVRLESERRVVLLQQQHEEKLNLLMRHFCDETSASSDRSDFDNPHKVDKIVSKMLERNSEQNNQICQIAGTSRQQQTNRLLDHPIAVKCNQDIDRHESRVITEYSEQRTRDEKKLIAKFQELTRYTSKNQRLNTLIPSQNLRQLQSTNDTPSTKVTRQKNKLIIQQSNTHK